jgi:hypothetical protein
MTKEAEQIGGKDVYSYTVEKGTSFGGMLFNCNGDDSKKTSDLTWTAGKYYVIDGWYTKEEVTNKLGAPATWTIVGNIPCLGAEWATDKAENDLVEGKNGVWTKTYTNVELAAETYEYKITKYHMWSESYPGENAKLEIAETGKYNLTFTFNENTKEVNCKVEKANNNPTALGNTTINNIYTLNRMIVADEEISIFTITGQNVTDFNGNLENGVYIVKSANATTKVVVK